MHCTYIQTGVEFREVRLIFAWSQLVVTDELIRRKRALSLTFMDFIEALARLSDLLSPPDATDVDAWFSTRQTPTNNTDMSRLPTYATDNKLSEYYRLVGAEGTRRKRVSAELTEIPTRPLLVKFEAMMTMIAHRLQALHGGKNEAECAARMKKLAASLSGGTI